MRIDKKLLVSMILFSVFVIWTVLVKFVDVAPIGPLGTYVGFSAVNGAVHNALGFSELFYKISEYSGYAVYVFPIIFAVIGVIQLIQKKSFVLVDHKLYVLLGIYVITVMFYLFFDKVLIINYRPVILPGEVMPEPSYPSTHALLSASFGGTAFLAIRSFVDQKTGRQIAGGVILAISVVSCTTRLLSGVHWLTDIIGGLLLGLSFMFLYYSISLKIDRKKRRKKRHPRPETE